MTSAGSLILLVLLALGLIDLVGNRHKMETWGVPNRWP